jgi:hypothetical protein
MLRTSRPALALLMIAVLATVSGGCTIGRVNERVAYWSKTTAQKLPPGSTLQDAKDLFAAAGLTFVCCVSAEPDLKPSWYAMERNVGRYFIVEYSVAVLVEVSPDDRILRVGVERWGVGL